MAKKGIAALDREGYSLSVAAKRLKWHRGGLAGALSALGIKTRYGADERGRVCRIVTDADIQKVCDATGRKRQ